MEEQTVLSAEMEPSWKRSVTEARLEPTRHGALKRVLLRHEDVHSPSMFLNEVYVAPGEQVERHQHEDMEEIFYILDGEGVMQLANEAQSIRPGDYVVVHAYTLHVIVNTGKQAMRFLCFGVKEMPDEIWEKQPSRERSEENQSDADIRTTL